MKKTVIIYTSRKTGKEFTFEGFINEGTTAVLVDSEGGKHLYAISTLKKNYKKAELEIEVPEEEKPMTKHQKEALKKIQAAYNWIVGALENDVQDGNSEEMPAVEDMFEEVYSELFVSDFDIGYCGGKAPVCIRFAGKAFIREQLAKLFKEDGYEVSDELVKVPEKKQGHNNIVDGERINVRRDDAAETVTVKAFTGMLIGVFEIESQTDTEITVKAAKGMLKFDRTTGVQLNAKNPKVANRIEVC